MVTSSDSTDHASAQPQNLSSPTPGPWLVEPINGGQTYQITSAEDRHFTVIAETPVDGTGRDKANAHLIASSPDLLATCRKAEQHIKQLCTMVNTYSNKLGLGDKVRVEHWLDHTSAAIAKAKGHR